MRRSLAQRSLRSVASAYLVGRGGCVELEPDRLAPSSRFDTPSGRQTIDQEHAVAPRRRRILLLHRRRLEAGVVHFDAHETCRGRYAPREGRSDVVDDVGDQFGRQQLREVAETVQILRTQGITQEFPGSSGRSGSCSEVYLMPVHGTSQM